MKWSPGVERVLAHVAVTWGWRVGNAGALRCPDGCPLASWRRHLGQADPLGSLIAFALLQGLTADDARLVMNAADDVPNEEAQLLRVDMLKAARVAA